VLVAAAVCPHPPMLVPAVAQGIAGELDECRVACAEVVSVLLDAEPDLLVVVGGGAANQIHDRFATGSLAAYGVELVLGSGDQPPRLPLSLAIGRWLIDPHVGDLPVLFQEIAASASPAACAALGDDLGRVAPRVALLAMGDGSAYPLQTPVGDDGRGTRYDDRAATALTSGDAEALLALDPADDGALWVAGRPAWQALGGALRADGRTWAGAVRWRGAPYGVGYVVAQLLPS
jgi:hypothetical protein